MNCRDLQELLLAYANGELKETQKGFIEEHLNDCVKCRITLAEYKKIREQLLTLRQTPGIPDIKEAIMLTIRKANVSGKPRRRLRPALAVMLLQFFGVFSKTTDVIAKAYAAGSSLESFRYVKDEYTQNSESEEPVHGFHAETEYTTPDRYHLIIEFPHSNIPNFPNRQETIRIGDQVYVKSPFVVAKLEDEWFKQVTPTKDKTLDFLNLLAKIETLKDESINGTDCYHYVGEVDIDKFLEWSRPDYERMYYRMGKSQPGGMAIDLETWIENYNSGYRTQDMTFEFWIGKDDYLLRKAKLVYQTRKGESSPWNKYKSFSIMNYSDFNKEIVIEPPLDESGELLKGWKSYTMEPLEIPAEPTPTTAPPAPRKPAYPQETPEAFTKALSVTQKLESFRVMSKTYHHFNEGWKPAQSSIIERGGDNLFHSLTEPTEEYKEAYPAMGITLELIVIRDHVYSRNFISPPKSADDFDDSGPTSESNLKILEMLFDIEALPDEEVNGVDCYHHWGILDVEKYLEWFRPVYMKDFAKMNEMQKETSGAEFDFEQSWKTIEIMYRSKETIYEYWIGKDDYLVRKKILTDRKLLENPLPLDDLSDESTRQVITEYYDFNEPVKIEAPLDESGELLEGWVLTILKE